MSRKNNKNKNIRFLLYSPLRVNWLKDKKIKKRTTSEIAKALASKVHFLNWDQWFFIRSNVMKGKKSLCISHFLNINIP